MGNDILLVEPDFKNKYPPLGLMKISTYHKNKSDNVVFCKGKNKKLRDKKWDKIYISTLFTFYWKKTIDTIKFYYNSVDNPSELYIGGVMATILYKELKKEPEIQGITIIKGLLDKPGILSNDEVIVDHLAPDYSIIETSTSKYLDYEYPTKDAYIAYATRGCIRKCKFCAVPSLEPRFEHYSTVSLKRQIENIKNKYGEKRNLLLLDNNVLASKEFEKIIQDIIDLGFGADNNRFTYKKNNRKVTVRRYVDFNQGIDARLLKEEKIELLSKIAIKPLRIAFDYADDEYVKLYTEKVRLASEYAIENLSNYVLFNYEDDTPEDLYKRLRINIELNEEFKLNGKKTQVWSFPMRYSPIIGDHCKDRNYVGQYWNKKFIRAIQCILSATHGVVGPKKNFFNKAFGSDIEHFKKILVMPEDYIIYRSKYEDNKKTEKWWSDYTKLVDQGREKDILDIIKWNKFRNIKLEYDEDLNSVLKHYIK